jgi:hypothetical protein
MDIELSRREAMIAKLAFIWLAFALIGVGYIASINRSPFHSTHVNLGVFVQTNEMTGETRVCRTQTDHTVCSYWSY